MRVYNEEVELDSRDPEQDYLLYKESCESLATLMAEIQELKAKGAKEGVRKIEGLFKQLSWSAALKLLINIILVF